MHCRVEVSLVSDTRVEDLSVSVVLFAGVYGYYIVLDIYIPTTVAEGHKIYIPTLAPALGSPYKIAFPY